MEEAEIAAFMGGPAKALTAGQRATLQRAREAQIQAWQAWPNRTRLHGILRQAVIEVIELARVTLSRRQAEQESANPSG